MHRELEGIWEEELAGYWRCCFVAVRVEGGGWARKWS
jgi:hypothetical protein